jgi:hypothetical protein
MNQIVMVFLREWKEDGVAAGQGDGREPGHRLNSEIYFPPVTGWGVRSD